MSRPRIHRNELERVLTEVVRLRAAALAFDYSNANFESAKAVHSQASNIAFDAVTALLRDYSVVRKSRTERTV